MKQINLTIKDKNRLLEVLQIISWFDEKRWTKGATVFQPSYCQNELTASEKLLSHFLTYFFDRQMPIEIIWDKGHWVASKLTILYTQDKLKPETVSVQNLHSEGTKKRWRFEGKSSSVEFSSRFMSDDLACIDRTLKILDNSLFSRNLVKYIVYFVKKYRDRKDTLIRVACALDLLGYRINQKDPNKKDTLAILKDDNKFEKAFKIFQENKLQGKKRLWCLLRDYRKQGIFYDYFIQGVEDNFDKPTKTEIKQIWDNLPLSQLELPGDVWNNNQSFWKNLMSQYVTIFEEPFKSPPVARRIYDLMLNELKSKNINFYPEQFDITFDFVPRMCATKNLCKVCPFSRDGATEICSSDTKYCPVALVCCGYTVQCIDKNRCPIKNKIGEAACKFSV